MFTRYNFLLAGFVLLAARPLLAAGPVLKYSFFVPLVVNGCQESNGAALAYLGSHTRAHVDGELCIDEWYTYNLQDYGDRYDAQQIPYAWCHESDYLPALYANYEQMFMALYPRNYDGRLLLWNEIGYRGQCEMTADEVARSWQFYRTYAPDAQLIVGNTWGHDGAWDFKRLRWIERAIRAGGGNICEAFAIGYHDYDHERHPSEYHLLLRSIVRDEWRCKDMPLMVTEWGALEPEQVAERRAYYNAQEDILQHFYFSPCQPPWDGMTAIDLSLFEVEWVPGDPWPQIVRCHLTLTELGEAFIGTAMTGDQ